MYTIKLINIFFCIVLITASCVKEELYKDSGNIIGKSFKSFLRVEGHAYDSLIIEDCVFDGGGLNIGNADHVLIKNCVFKNISNNALKVGFIGAAKGIIIDGCSFENIGYNAVDSHERALDCIIRNCTFEKVAQSDIGAAMAQAHHCIYWKGKNVLIEKNYFDASAQNFGNAISVRSSGVIRKNSIKNSPKNGIMYFSNHPGGDSLLIENNFFINNEHAITVATDGNEAYHNKNVTIRFNSIIQDHNSSIQINDRFQNTTTFAIYGNLIVNPTENYIKTSFDLDVLEKNLTASADIGFVAPSYDLHLKQGTLAEGFCANIVHPFPHNDIDGESRSLNTLNAGADE